MWVSFEVGERGRTGAVSRIVDAGRGWEEKTPRPVKVLVSEMVSNGSFLVSVIFRFLSFFFCPQADTTIVTRFGCD